MKEELEVEEVGVFNEALATNSPASYTCNQESLMLAAGANVSYAGVYPTCPERTRRACPERSRRERVRQLRTSRGDGNSLRVVKVWGADRTFYLYAGTQLISEFDDAASNTYSAGTTPGQAPADSTTTMLYQHSDHLTTRLTTDNFGNLSNEQAHYPYGEQWYSGGTANPSVLRKFTSYQKEDEAAIGKLNYAVYREHSARIGRFHMADPEQGNIGNPQALNRYAYVGGDPANRIDPKGLNLQNPFSPPPTFGWDWFTNMCFLDLSIGGVGISFCGGGGGGGGGGGFFAPPEPCGGYMEVDAPGSVDCTGATEYRTTGKLRAFGGAFPRMEGFPEITLNRSPGINVSTTARDDTTFTYYAWFTVRPTNPYQRRFTIRWSADWTCDRMPYHTGRSRTFTCRSVT